ncbi:MAG: hypothetical protein V4695_13275 [Pseudomonadota bacterium]
MTTDAPLDYFESDQVRHAVTLWRLVRKAGGADFDVLKFGRDWHYAETIVMQFLGSQADGVADAALVLLSLRMRLVQEQPERAQKLGALLDGAKSQVPTTSITSGAPKGGTTKSAGSTPASGPPKYVKSLR